MITIEFTNMDKSLSQTWIGRNQLSGNDITPDITFLSLFLSVSFLLFLPLYLYPSISPPCYFPLVALFTLSILFLLSFFFIFPVPPLHFLVSLSPSFSAPITFFPSLSFPSPLPVFPIPLTSHSPLFPLPQILKFPLSLPCHFPSHFNWYSPSSLPLSTLLFTSLHPSSSPFPSFFLLQ